MSTDYLADIQAFIDREVLPIVERRAATEWARWLAMKERLVELDQDASHIRLHMKRYDAP